MRLLPVLLAVLQAAGIVVADLLICYNAFRGTWYGDGWSVPDVNCQGGCRDDPFPHLKHLCMDWANRRGHFVFEGQSKRCLVLTSGDDDGATDWYERPCTW